ncbi:4-hydroxythreonine-4-phosphate dehydrogenase PdxA [Croceiramulus getboli]|nr:4-hydroxythreonine-4-phosphate dehydrogenase PdxA [Flavobacteriaceae bacterium YJPT1-3]
MKDAQSIRVGISIGDLNGIGSEIILKTFADTRMLEFCTPVVFASTKTLSLAKKQMQLSTTFHGVQQASDAVTGKLNVVNVWKEVPSLQFGEETKEAGSYALKSLRAATESLKEGTVDVLVTAPINKSNIQEEGFQFPGHTDYLAQELGGKSLMFMVTDTLKVGLLTDHVPVSEVSNHITTKLVRDKVETIIHTLKQDFAHRKPKVAVLGINPHVGDKGVIGKEDDEVLIPTLDQLRAEGRLVYGPYAADSFFGSQNYKNFDAIVAAYHDQGLIPFKTLSFGKGVNFTAGLAKVRTSPDHGTAYEIAGKGLADAGSFQQAVFTALSIYKNRSQYQRLSKDPLEPLSRKLKASRNKGGRSRDRNPNKK